MTTVSFSRLHHVQLAIPVGGEERCRAFWGGGVEVHLGVEHDFVPAQKAHPGIVVDDLSSLAALLQAAEVEVTWDGEFPGHDRFYAADPFGNRLELLQPQV